MKHKIKKILIYSFSLLVLIVAWYLISEKENASLIFPSPLSVIIKTFETIQNKNFWSCFSYTFLRVLEAFLITIFTGFVLGIIGNLCPEFRLFLRIPIGIIQTTPVIAIILIALFIFTSNSLPVFVAVLMALPVMINSVETGFENTPIQLLEMAKIFNFSKNQIIFKIELPFARESIFGGMETVFSLIWKVVTAGEVISMPKNGLGTIMNIAQIHLESSEVFAITIMLVSLSFTIEKILKIFLKIVLKFQK